MHSDELRKLNEGIEDPALYKIINELITRSDLHTAAIAAMHEPGVCSQLDNDMALLTHHVAPKKKYTVEDIVIEPYGSWHVIRCGDRWISQNWAKLWGTYGEASVFSSRHAEIVAAGLRATNNLPEEYK